MITAQLAEDEKVVIEGDTSQRALIITWCAIPGFFLINFILTVLPRFLKTAFSRTARELAMQTLGITNEKDFRPMQYAVDSSWGNIPGWMRGLLTASLVILVLAWLGFCLVMTYRHFQYKLAVTNYRVIGRAGDENMDVPLDEVVNAFVERSLWGKILNYGSIVVQTKNKTMTFRNLENPKKIHNLLMSYAENYCAH